MDDGGPWLVCLIRQLLLDSTEALLAGTGAGGVEEAGMGAARGGSARRESLDFDFLVGMRAEGDARMQLIALAQDMLEIVDSDLFAEVCYCEIEPLADGWP